MRRSLRASVEVALLLSILGALVWVTGEPVLFPSLGPSAFLLVVRPDAPASRPRRVLGGHTVGVVAGLLAYHALAGGAVVTAPPPAGSTAALGLAASGVFSVALTTGVMLGTGLVHSPACATTLIVSLGLLSTPVEGALVLLVVGLLVGSHRVLVKVVAGRDRPSGRPTGDAE